VELKRRHHVDIVCDTAVVAVMPAAAMSALRACHGQVSERYQDEVLMADTLEPGSFGIYQVADSAGHPAGLEIPISSSVADQALEEFITTRMGPWRPNVGFARRQLQSVATAREASAYQRYMAMKILFAESFLDFTVRTVDPTCEAEATMTGPEMVSHDGRFLVCAPHPGGVCYRVQLTPGIYYPAKWQPRADQGMYRETVVRIGIYRADLGVVRAPAQVSRAA
jgi:hypothetical protein